MQSDSNYEKTETSKNENGEFIKTYKIKFFKSGVYDLFLKKSDGTVVKQYTITVNEPVTTQSSPVVKYTPVINAPSDATWVYGKKSFKLSYASTSGSTLSYKSSDNREIELLLHIYRIEVL